MAKRGKVLRDANLGPGLLIVEGQQHSFALDSQNRPRFVYGNGWGNNW